jgi:hypothetical protein
LGGIFLLFSEIKIGGEEEKMFFFPSGNFIFQQKFHTFCKIKKTKDKQTRNE